MAADAAVAVAAAVGEGAAVVVAAVGVVDRPSPLTMI